MPSILSICVSAEERESRQRSIQIDREIEQDQLRQRHECKLLLLGSGESGKSTIVKQMKIIHQNGYTEEELQYWRPIIYRNLVDSARSLLTSALKLDLQLSNPEDSALIENFHVREDTVLPENLIKAIHGLWSDPNTPECLERGSSKFYIMDSAAYFMENVDRLAASNYIPSVDDVLRARLKTTGITETRFPMKRVNIHLLDVGGQRSERKKWIHCFEAVTSIVFVVALSEYDQVLLEETNQNRMMESLVLFESVINSRWFLRTSVILLLNKTDIFKEKMARVPLARYFPDYSGGTDVSKGAKYILWRFNQTNRMKLRIFPHLTQATDTRNIGLVFDAVEETVLKLSLQDSGIM
ncbi:heterotrimeric G-protein alpha subunit, GPA3-like protein [Syncephalastrum racemosum]|uniref:Heterotrimeric G-protein alpha subunit, GPA3-like protein n=1 Tax=Syncephalastrum racemosum TaxID=13706 RepID=A0A1X2H975_SYNRA|nr:heterotrimeric G-protein alpha subunit, GPA3-like protein [Syncephalastrum racemosum]